MSFLPRTIRFDPPGADEEFLVFEHDWPSETELGPSITYAIAELTGRTPEQVGTELRRTVDADGLDRLFRLRDGGAARAESQLVLSVASCEITVHSDGWVEVVHPVEPDRDDSHPSG